MKIPRQMTVPKARLELMVNNHFNAEFSDWSFTPGYWMVRVAISDTGELMTIRPLFNGDEIGITGGSNMPHQLLLQGIGLVSKFTDYTGYFNALLQVTENRDDAQLVMVPPDESLLNRQCSYLRQARIKNSFISLGDVSQRVPFWNEGARAEVVFEPSTQRVLNIRYKGDGDGASWEPGRVLDESDDQLTVTVITRDNGVDFGGIII